MSRWWRFLGVGVWVGGCAGLLGACSSPERDFSGGKAGSGGSQAGMGAAAGSGGTGAGGGVSEKCTAGETKSCYESSDGEAYAGMPPADQMTCRLGARKCKDDGTWDLCIGAVAPLSADSCEPGNDSSCNGKPNEGCTCSDGETRPCGVAIGNCKQGMQTCAGMAWGECVGEVKPAATDSCDEGDDANCNDKPNEGCDCFNGKTKDCGTDIGPCEFGTLTCTNGAWPADDQCLGGVKAAAADACDAGNDANCNGTPNEGCKCKGDEVNDMCGSNVGACKYGTQTCSGGVFSMCMGGVNPTTNDTCFADDAANDTNCNGHGRDGCSQCVVTDGDKDCGECGQSACDGATGKRKACVGDNTTLRCNPSDPTKRQVCGTAGVYVAKDCNLATEACSGQGVCKSKDGETCSTGATCASGSCNPFFPDADSDGYAADGSPAVNLCGAGKAGYVSGANNKGDDCDDKVKAINPAGKEVCDGLDNDCDGLTDFADTAPLSLSGAVQANVTGFYSAIASSGAAYGMTYFKSSKRYFATLTQANALGTVKDVEIGTDYNQSAITFDGTNFGVFQRTNFRTVSPAGVLGTAITLPDTAGAVDRWMAVRMPSQPWFMVGHSSYGAYPFGYSWMVSNTNVVSTVAGISDPQTNLDIAVSGTTYGLVYQEGTGDAATEVRAIKFSPRNTSGAETVSVAAFDSAVGLTKPVIAPRKGGGFVILWAGAGNKIYLREVKVDGSQQCATVSKTFTNFKPEQMVATSRGYLAVSSAAKTIQGQEILPGCKWGGVLPTIGTSVGDAHARIAAGTAGFAVIWDDEPEYEKSIYTRTFGPNFCD
jgi:hypothetical protein